MKRKNMSCICGVWLSLARALALGARGPRFKSLYPDYGVIRLMVGQEIVDLYVRVRFSYRTLYWAIVQW